MTPSFRDDYFAAERPILKLRATPLVTTDRSTRPITYTLADDFTVEKATEAGFPPERPLTGRWSNGKAAPRKPSAKTLRVVFETAEERALVAEMMG